MAQPAGVAQCKVSRWGPRPAGAACLVCTDSSGCLLRLGADAAVGVVVNAAGVGADVGDAHGGDGGGLQSPSSHPPDPTQLSLIESLWTALCLPPAPAPSTQHCLPTSPQPPLALQTPVLPPIALLDPPLPDPLTPHLHPAAAALPQRSPSSLPGAAPAHCQRAHLLPPPARSAAAGRGQGGWRRLARPGKQAVEARTAGLPSPSSPSHLHGPQPGQGSGSCQRASILHTQVRPPCQQQAQDAVQPLHCCQAQGQPIPASHAAWGPCSMEARAGSAAGTIKSQQPSLTVD
ncbi:hypothetical protein HaLaN_25742 [Haematococcus lacustris]|uniref:Uncharacterized protein n=1 Tax=Haematococcus lacustris TaxID=44745 RepID=A0A699ZXP3_HAELA|nr:hypothetical protein HaLaN_25742 [Haematococcus lacustris]